ncbi:hypothetical protein G7046_g6443 [Stylonectria norvegica]|nr:hypothetical protein G7046_g6443 [Stylonectria norvegica]
MGRKRKFAAMDLPLPETQRLMGSPNDGVRLEETTIRNPRGNHHVVDLGSISDEKTRTSLRSYLRHKHSGWIDPTTLEFGDVICMCTYHESYGEGQRRYMFWKMITFNGRSCPVFLTLLTSNGAGPEDSGNNWFSKDISFYTNHPEKAQYISPVQAIVVLPPSHGQIHGQRYEGKRKKVLVTPCFEPPSDPVDLELELNHIVDQHLPLYKLLCRHLVEYKRTRAGDVKNSLSNLRIRTELREPPNCSLRGSTQYSNATTRSPLTADPIFAAGNSSAATSLLHIASARSRPSTAPDGRGAWPHRTPPSPHHTRRPMDVGEDIGGGVK